MSCSICQGVRRVAQVVSDFFVVRGFGGPPMALPPVAAYRGHVFCCRNGHPMCEAIQTIRVGDERWDRKLGNWRQRIDPPKFRDEYPECPRCGATIVLYLDTFGIPNGPGGYASTPT